MWGQSKEKNTMDADIINALESSTENTPLLQNWITEDTNKSSQMFVEK